MQRYNENDEVIKSQMINDDELSKLKAAMNDKETSYVVLGEIPKVNYRFKLGGLEFKVIMSNSKKGRFTAELIYI